MTQQEFNEKYVGHLGGRFYGLSLDIPEVTDYLDVEFTKEIEETPDFQYFQIKMKFNTPRVYTTSDKDNVWENQINKIIKGIE